MNEKKDKAQFKVNVDIIERIDKLEKAVFDILTILTGEFAGESDVLKRLTGHINKICSKSPAPTSNESGMSDEIKQKLITAHLVSAIETIASTYGDAPTMLQELEERLDKIREIYTNDSVSVDIKAGVSDNGCGSNSPAPVSDGECEWIVNDLGTILQDNFALGSVFLTAIPDLRTLIAKAEIAEKMCKLLKHYDSHSIFTDVWESSYKSLIVEYEEVNK